MSIYDPEGFKENIADGGDFLVITFTKSKSQYPGISGSSPVRVKSREHWFFKVEASRRITYRPYNAGQSVAAFKQQSEDSPIPYIDPAEGVGPVPLIDQTGEEVLRNDDDEWFVYHVGVSPIQGSIRVYPRTPDSQPGGVFQYLGSNRPNGLAGDPIGYVSGDDHPSFYDPQTGISSTLVWDQGINTNIKYQFYNEHQTKRAIPLLNIFGAGYTLSPVIDDDVQRNILDAADTGHDNVTHIEWGPIRETFSYDVPSEWDTTANYIEEVEPNIPEEFQSGPNTEIESSDDIESLARQVADGDVGSSPEAQSALEELVNMAQNNG